VLKDMFTTVMTSNMMVVEVYNFTHEEEKEEQQFIAHVKEACLCDSSDEKDQ